VLCERAIDQSHFFVFLSKVLRKLQVAQYNAIPLGSQDRAIETASIQPIWDFVKRIPKNPTFPTLDPDFSDFRSRLFRLYNPNFPD